MTDDTTTIPRALYDPPSIAKALRGLPAPQFYIRPETSDAKAVGEVWVRNQYVKHPALIPREGEVWLDLGANIGAYTRLATTFGARVTAFEAEPTNVEIGKGNATDATWVWAAVVPDDHQGDTIALNVNTKPLSLRRHSVMLARRGSTAIDVPAHRIGELCAELHPAGMKINIEGVEIPVLQTWEPNAELRAWVAEWSFDADRRTGTLRDVLDRWQRMGWTIRPSRSPRSLFAQDTYPWFPPNVYLHAWREDAA